MPFVVLNRPEFVKHVLQDNHANYDKDVFLFKITKPLFGEGLVTSAGGDPWLRQRRLVQPAFHRDRLAGFASTMVQAVQEMLEGWARQPDADPQVSLAESIIGLTMQIACRTLISVDDFGPHIERFADSFLTIDRALSDFARMPFPPLGFPTAGHRRMWNALKRVDDIVYGIIAERRRRSDTSADDVLSMLMHAVDEETGTGMTDQQLRDELVTILIAGFETTANALCWTLIQLDPHPEVTARLIEEVDSVLADRPPAVDDLAGLTYTRIVLQEALRLHTPS
jgi:cytochrome P450